MPRDRARDDTIIRRRMRLKHLSQSPRTPSKWTTVHESINPRLRGALFFVFFSSYFPASFGRARERMPEVLRGVKIEKRRVSFTFSRNSRGILDEPRAIYEH